MRKGAPIQSRLDALLAQHRLGIHIIGQYVGKYIHRYDLAQPIGFLNHLAAFSHDDIRRMLPDYERNVLAIHSISVLPTAHTMQPYRCDIRGSMPVTGYLLDLSQGNPNTAARIVFGTEEAILTTADNQHKHIPWRCDSKSWTLQRLQNNTNLLAEAAKEDGATADYHDRDLPRLRKPANGRERGAMILSQVARHTVPRHKSPDTPRTIAPYNEVLAPLHTDHILAIACPIGTAPSYAEMGATQEALSVLAACAVYVKHAEQTADHVAPPIVLYDLNQPPHQALRVLATTPQEVHTLARLANEQIDYLLHGYPQGHPVLAASDAAQAARLKAGGNLLTRYDTALRIDAQCWTSTQWFKSQYDPIATYLADRGILTPCRIGEYEVQVVQKTATPKDLPMRILTDPAFRLMDNGVLPEGAWQSQLVARSGDGKGRG